MTNSTNNAVATVAVPVKLDNSNDRTRFNVQVGPTIFNAIKASNERYAFALQCQAIYNAKQPIDRIVFGTRVGYATRPAKRSTESIDNAVGLIDVKVADGFTTMVLVKPMALGQGFKLGTLSGADVTITQAVADVNIDQLRFESF